MDFDSPDVAKDFPGLYASDSMDQNQDSDSDAETHDKHSKKELLIGKKKDKKDSKKDKGYVAFEGESSDENMEDSKSPTKAKKSKSFKFPGPKKDKSKEKVKEVKEPKKEVKENKKEKEVKENKKEKEVKENKKDKKKSTKKEKRKSKVVDDTEDRAIFGVPLQIAVERNKCHDGIELPVIVRECLDYIEQHGLSCEGIYRLSGVKSKVQQLKQQYDDGIKVDLLEHEPHVVASVLKLFMRELPEPVLTSDLNLKFDEASAVKNESVRESKLKDLIGRLPLPNRLLLSWIFVHMNHVIAREANNKMSLENVAIVLSPTMQISHRAINALFLHSNELFKGVEIKKYVPPIRPETSRLSLELPDTPTAIEEELHKQESLLNQLHAELNAGLKDSTKEEELWEVQRVVTQLKRKLRFARRPLENTESAVEKKIPTSIDEEIQIDTRLQQVDDQDAQPQTDTKHEKSETDANVTKEPKETSPIPTPTQAEETKVLEGQPSDDVKENITTEVPDKAPEAQDVAAPKSSEHDKVNETNELTEESKTMQNEEEEDSELLALIKEEKRVRLENAELISLDQDLRRRIQSEKSEAERLMVEIEDRKKIFRYRGVSFDSDYNSSNSSDDSESEDEDALLNTLERLEKENQEYKMKNSQLMEQIQKEREACMSIKVQIRILNEKNSSNQISVH